jgi:hypothetical protein
MSTAVAEVHGSKDIARYSPKEGAAQVHLTDAATKMAERAKDITAFANAITKNLNAKHDFAAHYKTLYGNWDRSVPDSREDYCAGFGFVDRTVRRWCETLLPDGGLEKAISSRVDAARKRFVDDVQAANFSSAEIEWYTPVVYVRAARKVLGDIDLDPASCLVANESGGAAQIFTIKENALAQPWHGRVFMNPPYGIDKETKSSVAGMFCQKAIDEYIAGNVEAAIILVNSSHAQRWQASLYDYPVCFVDHRISFVSSDGVVNKAPTFMNIFVYLGADKAKFAEVFSEFGYVMERLRAA